MEFFGRFFETAVFIYARNWLIINLEDQSQRLIPITSKLKLESHHQTLQIEWLPLGITINFKNGIKNRRVIVPGELHQFNFFNERSELEISTFEKKRALFNFDDLLMSEFHLSTSMRLMSNSLGTQYNFLPSENEQLCVVYLHGGPFQRHTNEYNAILSNCAKAGFNLIIPHYPGDPFSDNSKNILPGSEQHIEQLRSLATCLQEQYNNIIYIGHSFGCYLGHQLLSHGVINSLFSINGLFDLETLKECSPKTFSDIQCSNAPKTNHNYNWIHIQSDNDPIIDLTMVNSSLNKILNKPTTKLMIESKEHELTEEISIQFVINTIIENI